MPVRPAPWRDRRPPDPSPGSAHSADVSSRRRRELLDVLHDAPAPLGVSELAELLDVHPNTVRFHLDTLVERGQVERVSGTRRRPGRPPTLFRAVPAMDPDGPRHFLTLAEVLVDELASSPEAGARAVAAGQRWGARLTAPVVPSPRRGPRRQADPATATGPRRQLTALMRQLGFAPDSDEEQGEDSAVIELRHCPFLELAVVRPQVVCSVHLGILRGALEAWDAPITVDRLEPFVAPDLCRAHLAEAAGSAEATT